MSYHTELAPQTPPSGWTPANPLIGTLSPEEQWEWNGAGWELNSDFVYESTPIVEVNLQATVNDNFFFQSNPDEQYIGPYHRHEDGTLMIGDGIPDIEPKPESPPQGRTPENPLIGTLSPQGQWVWNGGAWEENPDYDPSSQSTDYLPSGQYGHLTPIEETGFDFGKFIWLKQGNPNFPDGEPIEIYKDISDDIPNTLI